MVWCGWGGGVVWGGVGHSVAWHGVAWHGEAWRGVVGWRGVAWRGVGVAEAQEMLVELGRYEASRCAMTLLGCFAKLVSG